MSVSIPEEIRFKIRELIYQRADSVNYLAQGRIENGKFMEQLVKDPAIGGCIAQYTGKGGVKTYIKDGVLNRYAKEKTRPPSDLCKTVGETFGEEVSRIDEGGEKGISLYRGKRSGVFVVASSGRLLKWETALRKLLEHLGRNSGRFDGKGSSRPRMILILMTGGLRISSSDKQLLERSLDAIQVKVRVL